MEQEYFSNEWFDIPKYEGIYQINKNGCVKSLQKLRRNNICTYMQKEKIMKPVLSSQGYLCVSLTSFGKSKTYQIHTILAEVFMNHTFDGKKQIVVNHIDGNKINNSLYNLELVTKRENSSTCFRKNQNTTTSKFIGVFKGKKDSNYRACFIIKKKRIHLGMFKLEIEAAKAYNLALKNFLEYGDCFAFGENPYLKHKKKYAQTNN